MGLAIRIMFAGGGTGGHLFPAIAIADEVRKIEPSAEILFIGTKDKIEARVVPAQGYHFRTIWVSGFRRGLRIGNILFPLKVIVSMIQSRSLIREFRPDVVVGTGGYVSGPVLRAAMMQHVPTLIQEQNSYPGVTTRMLAKRATEVHLTFQQSVKYFSGQKNLQVTGNPTRANLENADRVEALRFFGFRSSETRRTVLIFGGSLGARSINRAVHASIEALVNHGIRIIWQTGNEDYADAARLVSTYGSENVWVGLFIDRMEYAYSASDLVVCRAGATTIAELTRVGKPAVLVPYPHAAANHQVENANTMVSEGAATSVDDNDVEQKLLPTIIDILDEGKLKSMQNRSKQMGKPGAARTIAERIVVLARSERASVN